MEDVLLFQFCRPRKRRLIFALFQYYTAAHYISFHSIIVCISKAYHSIYIPYTYYHKYNHVYHFSSSGVLQRPAKDYDATNAAIRQGQQIIEKENENQSPNEGDNMTSPVIGKEDKYGQI